MTHSDNMVALTMKAVFLEDYFVSATFYADETEHTSRFCPVSEIGGMPEDYPVQLKAILEDPAAEYVNTGNDSYHIDMSDAHKWFETMAGYFSCHSSVGFLEIRRCFGWRFEHHINGISTDMIYTPWQADKFNLTLADAKLHIQQILSGERYFYNS